MVVRGRYFDGDESASVTKVCLLTDELAATMFHALIRLDRSRGSVSSD